MANFAIEIFDDEGSKCVFYTVKWEGEAVSEAEKFFTKYYNIPQFRSFTEELAKFINLSIAEKYGALDGFFRWEKTAQALPPNPNHSMDVEEIEILANFPLRLYCIRLSKSCVVLFNGAEKTSDAAQDGKTSMAFHDANIFASKILSALQHRHLKLSSDERYIIDDLDNYNINDILL